jgi:N-acetylmuramic acid 6-phosphate (MurNAc-6-P) etherase
MAVQAIRDANGNVRLAAVMAKKHVNADEARQLLDRHSLREVLQS